MLLRVRRYPLHRPLTDLWGVGIKPLHWQLSDVPQEELLEVVQKQDGLALLASPSCAAHSVDVLRLVCRHAHLQYTDIHSNYVVIIRKAVV